MQLLTYVAYFFGGVFFVNAVPHFTNRVSGPRRGAPRIPRPGARGHGIGLRRSCFAGNQSCENCEGRVANEMKRLSLGRMAMAC
jgi:hypothetical protein